jgi:hypothetical protein
MKLVTTDRVYRRLAENDPPRVFRSDPEVFRVLARARSQSTPDHVPGSSQFRSHGAVRITPTFVLPHKRYETGALADLCREVVDANQPLRKAAANADGRPMFHCCSHDVDAKKFPALSHTTIHRWLTFFGAMIISLQVGTETYLSAQPESTIHRFQGRVDPRRARSDPRLDAIVTARRLLYLQTLWDHQFLTTPFFARFATVCRPP